MDIRWAMYLCSKTTGRNSIFLKKIAWIWQLCDILENQIKSRCRDVIGQNRDQGDTHMPEGKNNLSKEKSPKMHIMYIPRDTRCVNTKLIRGISDYQVKQKRCCESIWLHKN